MLATFSLQDWRHHPWRTGAAVAAIALGVALALAVHLINASALSEFSAAVRTVNGQPDVQVRWRNGPVPDVWLDHLSLQPQVEVASPVLEQTLQWQDSSGQLQPIRLLGVDALTIARVSPQLLPLSNDSRRQDSSAGTRRLLDAFQPDTVFLNPAATALAGLERADGQVNVISATGSHTLRLAGTVAASGPALLVMDVAAAQALTGHLGDLTRIDLKLNKEVEDPRTLGLPEAAWLQRPTQADDRASQLSGAYRVNLTVLALVALFTGAFLVFSVLSLSVARRQQQFALLGVLGLPASARLQLVIAESLCLGLIGSLAGVALGTGLSWLALRLLGGDLGGGYFAGVAPALHWSPWAATAYGLLGVAAAVLGGWWPARSMAQMAPAPALKGLGQAGPTQTKKAHAMALGTVTLAGLLSLLPPWQGIPLAAYFSIALLLLGGIAALPLVVGMLLDRLAPHIQGQALALLAVERSRRLRETAAVATSGVVASLALSVALTVMVSSFRESVTEWLEGVLPAQLYVRAGGRGLGDGQALTPTFADAVQRIPGIERMTSMRAMHWQWQADMPPVMILARPLRGIAPATLAEAPLSPPAASPDGRRVVPVYISEPMRDLYGIEPGQWLDAFTAQLAALNPDRSAAPSQRLWVTGVWRDYARQHGSLLIDLADYQALTGDLAINDLALFLAADQAEAPIRSAIESAGQQWMPGSPVEVASASAIRATSLQIFDRSFAVTYWLQAVAIGIGLFGVAASFSAQVMARRKEFGLLAHLGLTRRQILSVVAIEGLSWTTLGALAGLLLGLAVSVILVKVVNPQSFHWTMDLQLPPWRLLALCTAVMVAGTFTAWFTGRSAASRDAVQAVKEDW